MIKYSIVFFHRQIFFLNYDVFLTLKVVLILVKSADLDEMQHYAAFHVGLHCLPKYQLRGFQNTKGLCLLNLQSCCGGGDSCLLCFEWVLLMGGCLCTVSLSSVSLHARIQKVFQRVSNSDNVFFSFRRERYPNQTNITISGPSSTRG